MRLCCASLFRLFKFRQEVLPRRRENIDHREPLGVRNVVTAIEREMVLSKRTGSICNPHTFRRTFASNLHRAGLDIEHIMRLGGWESLDMVVRYTRSVKFEESLKLYNAIKINV